MDLFDERDIRSRALDEDHYFLVHGVRPNLLFCFWVEEDSLECDFVHRKDSLSLSFI